MFGIIIISSIINDTIIVLEIDEGEVSAIIRNLINVKLFVKFRILLIRGSFV